MFFWYVKTKKSANKSCYNGNKKRTFFNFMSVFKKENTTKLIAGLLLGSIVFYIFYGVAKPIARSICSKILEEDPEAFDRTSRSITVEAEPVKFGSMSKQLSTTGTLKANASVEIKSEIDARLSEIKFSEGTAVKKGQVIIKFDDEEQQAAFEKATALRISAEAEYKRNLKLLQQKAGSQKDYDKAYGEYLQAKAAEAEAKARLSKYTIAAPFDGTIGIIDVTPGAFVQRAQKLVMLVDMTPIKIDFRIPAQYAREIGVGQAVDFTVEGKTYRATIEAVDSSIDPEAHSIAVKASIPNEDGSLMPGNFVSLSVITAERGDVLKVLESAIERRGEVECVWIVEKGKLAIRRVITGAREDGYVEIVGGIQEGQVVVTAGQQLSEGVPAKVIKPETENIKSSSEKD
jgi:membrane fusion protein (multidrug efflux system)